MENRILHNRYRLRTLVGRGGTGSVWLAEELQLGQKRAVKYLSGKDEQGIGEAEILARLNHPAIPRFLEWIREEDGIFLVMDFIEGKSLETVRKRGHITAPQAVNWGIQLCRVLEYLHGQNPQILYRDMKPANVILDPQGFLHLIDFGAAGPMGRKGKTYGTPGYAAPEQYLGAAGPDSDVYGVGRLLQELLPKKRARGLHRIVRKSVHKEREKRFHTAEEFRVALEKWERRNRRTGKAFTVTAVLSAAVLVMGWRISEEVRELQYQEALRMGRGAVVGGREEQEIHRYYGQAIYLEPGRAEPYLELLSYYVQRGEEQLGCYYVEEYLEAYPDGLQGKEKIRLEEKLAFFLRTQ